MSRRRGLVKRFGRGRPAGERHVEDLLSIYNILAAEEQALVQDHLENCAGCRNRLAAFQQMDRLLRQSRWQNPDRKLRDGFYAAIDAGATKNRSLWRGNFAGISRAAGRAAGLVLLAAVIAVVWLSVRQRVEAPAATTDDSLVQPTSLPPTPSLPDTKAIPLSMTLAKAGSADILALSGDGRFVAAARGSQVQIWATATGRLLESFFIRDETAVDMAFSPNDLYLVVRTSSGRLQRWRVAGGIRLADGDTVPSVVPDLPFAASNALLALATAGSQVELWELESGVKKATLPDHKDTLTALSISANSDILLVGDGSGVVHMWDLDTESASQLVGPKQPVVALDISQRGNQIAAAFADGRTRIWAHENAGGTILQTLPARESNVWDLHFANDGKTILRLLQDGTLEHWPVGDDLPYVTLTVPTLRSSQFALLPGGLIVAGITVDGRVALWEKSG